MMRTRAVDPLRRLAGARVQPKALTAVTSMAAIKAAAVSATDGISDGGAGRYQRLVRHRSTAAAAAGATSMHPPRRVCTNGLTGMSTSVRGWGALPSSGQQGQFHSCTSCRVPSIESGGMQDTPCWKGTPQGVVGRRAMSTTKDGSPQAGAETANGITFETGKVCCCVAQHPVRSKTPTLSYTRRSRSVVLARTKSELYRCLRSASRQSRKTGPSPD